MSSVTLTISVSKKDHLRASLEPIHVEKFILMTDAIDKPATVVLSNSMTVPGIYGDYSSHNVGITLHIPVTEDELDNFEGVADNYLERTHTYARNVINNICSAQGKPVPFIESGAEEQAEKSTGIVL